MFKTTCWSSINSRSYTKPNAQKFFRSTFRNTVLKHLSSKSNLQITERLKLEGLRNIIDLAL